MKTTLITLITFFISFSNLFSQVAMTCEIGDCENGYGECTYYDGHFGKRMRYKGIFRNEKFQGPGTIYNLNDKQFLLMADFSNGEFIRPLNSREKKTRDKYPMMDFYKNIDFIMENALINVTKIYKSMKFEHDYQSIKPNEPWDVQSFLKVNKGELTKKQAENLDQFINDYIKEKINPEKKLYGGFHFLQYVPPGKKPYVLDFPINTKLGDWKEVPQTQKSNVTFKNGIIATSKFSNIFGDPNLVNSYLTLPNSQVYTIQTKNGIPTFIKCISSPANMSRTDLALRRVPFFDYGECVAGSCIPKHTGFIYFTYPGLDPDAQGIIQCDYDANGKCNNPRLFTHDGFMVYLEDLSKPVENRVLKAEITKDNNVDVILKNKKFVSPTGEFSENEHFFFAKRNKMGKNGVINIIKEKGFQIVKEKTLKIETKNNKVTSSYIEGLKPNTYYVVSSYIAFVSADYQVNLNTKNAPFLFQYKENETTTKSFNTNIKGGFDNIYFKTPDICPSQGCSLEYKIKYFKNKSEFYPDMFPMTLFLVTNK
jgi:hypothetical protein